MDLLLQIWGGSFYLANKILFALSENRPANHKKKLKGSGWIIYLLGVPAWVIILAKNDNWIAASIELGGVPAMLLGLYNVYYDNTRPNRLFNRLVFLSTYSSLIFGIIYSYIIFNGISSVSQILEIGMMLGFLLGSYYMAKNSAKGWLFFMLMNLSTASLMMIQAKPVLMLQQLISFGFVYYGFHMSKQKT